MIRTIGFNMLEAGTRVEEHYLQSHGVGISALGGVNQAVVFDSSASNTDPDLGSENLGGLLILAQQENQVEPASNPTGGSLFFDFETDVRVKSLTFKDIEETGGTGTRMIFYDAAGEVIENHYVDPTEAGGERTVGLAVEGVARMEVRLTGTGAVDNLVFEDGTAFDGSPTAVDDQASTTEETAVIIDLRGNDFDPDHNLDELTLSDLTSVNGEVIDNGDGTVTFFPATGFVGEAQITYTLEDPDGNTDQGTAEITVSATDDPTERDGIVQGTEGDDLIDLGFDGDPDGDQIDHGDAILPGQEPDDDIVRAGGGSDIVRGGNGDDDIDTQNSDPARDAAYPLALDGSDTLGYDADPDPDNDRDFVEGGEGEDTIATGDDRDTIMGGTGADQIDAGIDDDFVSGDDGDDLVFGGEGNDTLLGGSGNDTIYADNSTDASGDVLGIPDDALEGYPLSPDRNLNNAQDFVLGGAGDDLIFGGDDNDQLFGEDGDDTLHGQLDDDMINGGFGADDLVGGQGNDTLQGGAGADQLAGGEGQDILFGQSDEDRLMGGEGDDLLDGGGENDLLEGEEGDDILRGGDGDDTLMGGEGADVMSGGAGQDVFGSLGIGDFVDGGTGPVDFDTLDLRGSAAPGGRLSIQFTSDDRENGIVSYFDADDVQTGQLVFSEIEAVVPCFTPGTLIATPSGERRVEDLKVGDRVITRDNGMQEVRWCGRRDLNYVELAKAPHLQPVKIAKGSLGFGLPERDLVVSPNHRLLIASEKTALFFEEREVLVAARHLVQKPGISVMDVPMVSYIHIMFDQHEIVLSNGAWTESFQPGEGSLSGIGAVQRQEIFQLFPQLAEPLGVEAYGAARRSLKRYEAALLTEG